MREVTIRDYIVLLTFDPLKTPTFLSGYRKL